MKVCTRCGERKALSEFRLRPESPDGRRGVCKACMNASSRGKYKKQPHSPDSIAERQAAMDSKPCTVCGVSKPLGGYQADAYRPDGLTAACKDCRNTQSKEWREANPERVRANSAAWYAANLESHLAVVKAWQRRNAERVTEVRRRYRKANAERLAVTRRAWTDAHPGYSGAWQKANPEKAAATRERYRKNNPEKLTERARKRRALRHAATVGLVDLDALWTGTCALCSESMNRDLGFPDPLSKSVDHIVPLTKGGGHTQDNLQWAHLVCNMRKGNRVSEAVA